MSEQIIGRTRHVDQHLSNVALNYRPMGFVADRVFPVVPVPKQSDTYLIYEQADMFRQENTLRAPGQEANLIYSRVSSAGFFCRNYALKKALTLEDRLNADPIFAAQQDESDVMTLMDRLLIDWEVRMFNKIGSFSNVGTYAAVASSWTDFTNSDPVSDLNTMFNNVEDATGYRPNRVLMSGTAWRNFRRNAKVIDKSTNPNVSAGGNYPSVQQAQATLEAEILVAAAYYNTKGEGQAMTLSRIAGDHVWLLYAPPAPAKDRPSAGYAFRWQAPGLPNLQVERHPYDPRRKSVEMEAGYYQDEVVTAKPLICAVTNVTSST